MLKLELLAVVYMVSYTHMITHVDFRCETGYLGAPGTFVRDVFIVYILVYSDLAI